MKARRKVMKPDPEKELEDALLQERAIALLASIQLRTNSLARILKGDLTDTPRVSPILDVEWKDSRRR